MEREGKKTEDCENVLFKALANRFWVTLNSCSWFNKVIHGRPPIKWNSWEVYYMLLKVDKMYSLLKKIPLEMVIGLQMKEKGHDQN